ncbi:Enoyl-CoA hydratase/isomerase:3-hydroxyacyl-CoA dehydrogenase, 3-hydroxyacyl-CoA dehydrogenase, NAD-binding protein [Rhodobacterales bacterium HTCC2150]|nr:Enoyl-CoA hydratase/isomerase:3-hydroxyacyl-CoA dehydrogenase, 3-hydroxyacyl-CoA dehydrogenase, NAD-binding protein [Rhodobacterales bacterium HTCC2150] [Rhodobacteraceae bacterium HTCC2150]
MVVSVRSVQDVAIVTIENPPVNAISHAVRQGLLDAKQQIEADPAIKAGIIVCADRTFIAGADIREFNTPPKEPHLPDLVIALEGGKKPLVAAIHGTALGGGLEIALGCDYRIAINSAKLGLPEVNLGLIPGAGGTVRLTRLISAEPALDIMISGKPVSADRAKNLGLIDATCDDDLQNSAIAFANRIKDEPRPSQILTRMADYDRAALDKKLTAGAAKARGQNSPVAVCQAVRNAIEMSAHDALAAERKLFVELKSDPQSLALRHIFFAERATSKISAIKGVPAAPVNQIGIIGGGTMGAGIAAACLLAGFDVVMIERNDEALAQGMSRTKATLANSLKRGLITQAKHDRLIAAFTGSISYIALADADLVIEAVFEDMEIKKAVFDALDQACKADAIFATNTSYLDIDEIAQSTINPTRVIGLHFFSPAHIMKLLELVTTKTANPTAIATGVALGKRLGKITVPSGVCDGFIGNRIMSAYRRTCDYLIEDGALPADVDAAMRDFGFPMGIFEMQDLAGLDIAWAMRKRRAATRDPQERYVDIADTLCEMGRFGRKTGSGWYQYENGKATIDPTVTDLILQTSARNGITRASMTADEIMAQILATMRTEAAAILDEGIANSADDIDVVMVNGYGFPRWKGGPLFMALKP